MHSQCCGFCSRDLNGFVLGMNKPAVHLEKIIKITVNKDGDTLPNNKRAGKTPNRGSNL